MYSKIRAAVVGSINMDFIMNMKKVPETGENLLGTTYGYANGGKGANQATCLSRLGADTKMIGKVADDENGHKLLENLKKNNNDLTYLINEDDPFSENPHIFKMTLKCGMWSVGTLTENDKNTAMSSLLVRHDYGTRKIYQEDELEEQLKKMT